MFSTTAIDKRSLAGYLSIAILSLPLFFINVRDTHDWGDDFAGYIHQAENIVNGIPQSSVRIRYNEDYHSVVPDVGFPLMLAPVHYLFGNDTRAFLLLISLTLFLLSLALMRYYTQYFSPLASCFLCLVTIYNPWVLSLKGEILSDIPFTLVLILSFIYYQTKGTDQIINCVLLGLMVGYLISIRFVGLAFPLALGGIFIKRFIRSTGPEYTRNLIKSNMILAVSIAGVYFLLNRLLFPTPPEASYVVPEQLSLTGMGSSILNNLNTYSDSIYTFFRSLGRYQILTIAVRSLVVVSLAAGIFLKLKERADLMDLFVWIYFLSILIFGGIDRYLFPILPFLFHYMAFGLQSIKLNLRVNRNIVATALGCFVLLTYYPEVKWIIQHQDEVQKGPQEPASLEAFEYIKKNTPENSVIVFAKPRALALYTGRIGMWNEPTDDLQKLMEKFETKDVQYVLIHSEETKEPTLRKLVEEYKESVTLEWSNEKFALYKITPLCLTAS